LTNFSQHVILFRRDKLSSILKQKHGGNMNTNSNYTTHTGTFVKQNGQTRTMTFIKGTDVPNTVSSGTGRTLSEGQELVFDIERNGFRVFNWNTVQGTVSQGSTSYNFRSNTRS
jgi:hypothetical protein